MISIGIHRLTRRFGQVAALQDLDLEIGPGELFFLLGPSGCGKTTLLRCLAGFNFPDEGQVLFDGEDVTRMPPHKRNTGMVFQSYALWPHMTVAGNVAFGLEERGVARAEIARRVGEALESVHMGAFGERRPNQLSGGQQQRVALARALVVRPRCLLLDEPLSNLDARLRLEMRAEIRRVCKEFKLTTVYVTHDQKEALSVADRMAVLDGGRILQVGTPRQVYRRPVCRKVADFIGEADFIAGTVVSVEREGGADRALVRVRTELGAFAGVLGDPARPPAAGAAVTVSVRPECWTISAEPGPVNSVAGGIGELVYLGDSALIDFRASGSGVVLKALALNPREFTATGSGPLHLGAAVEDVVVLAT